MRAVVFMICVATFMGIRFHCGTAQVITEDTGFSGCDLHLKSKSWYEAMEDCKQKGKMLLCYNSKEDIQMIVKLFKMNDSRLKLRMWLSARDCTPERKIQPCLLLNIHRSDMTPTHYFEKSCTAQLPFICCPKDTTDPPTDPPITTPATTTKSTSSGATTNMGNSTTTSIYSTSISDGYSEVSVSTVTMTTKNNIDITTHSMTPLIITTSTPFPSGATCKSVKKRGILWPEAFLDSVVSKPCPGNSRGNATWFCSAVSGDWSPARPDMSQCYSMELDNLKEKFDYITAKESIDILTTLYKDEEMLQANDLVDSVDLISKLPDKFYGEVSGLPETARYRLATDTVTKTTSVFDKMIGSDVWGDVPGEKLSNVGSRLLSTVDNFGFLLARTMTNATTEHSIVKNNIMMEVMNEKCGDTLDFPRNSLSNAQKFERTGRVTLYSGYANQLDRDKGPVSIVYVFYSDMNNILVSQGGTGILNSPVVSVSVSQESLQPISIHANVHVLVEHFETNVSTCTFWNLKTNSWDNAGCELLDSNSSHSLCSCDHLTNFAVLMDFRGVITNVDSRPLFFITVIGCSLSIISLAICITVFTCYRYHQRNAYNVRYSIHRNLCITLFLANLLLLFGLNRTENQIICAVIAGFLHYLFLSAFSWMLLEGVHIYLLLVVVFASKRTHWQKYYLFGYGFPLLIVGITAASRPTSYGTPERCWLSTENESMWSFAGPVAFILLMNTAALILAQFKASKISVKNDKASTVKRWLRVTLILFPILGLTWGLGFLYAGEHATIMAYIFAFLNSLQGFCIFICHCVMDKKVRTMVTTSINRKRATITSGSADSKRALKRDSNTPIADSPEGANDKKTTFGNMCRNKWDQFKRPWAFCFTLDIGNRTSSSMCEEQDKIPNAVAMHWTQVNNVKAQ